MTITADVINGDCLEIMRRMEPDSIDCIVTDPPYFLLDKSGKGFMGKEWDSATGLWRYLWRNEEFVEYVEKFFTAMQVEKNTAEENIVLNNANTKQKKETREKRDDVRFVKRNSELLKAVKRDFAQVIVLTKREVLDLLKELLPSHIKEKFLQDVQDDVRFVMAPSLLKRKLKNTVPENVLKRLIKKECEEKTIQLTLMDAVRKNVAIEGMIGKKYDIKSIRETTGLVKYVEKNAHEKKFNATILSLIKNKKTIKNLTLLLFALTAIQNTKIDPFSLVENFWQVSAKECLRVLKPGAFMFMMSSPRADCLWRMMAGLESAGFEIAFTPIFWAYASGYPKGQNISKAADKYLGAEREVTGKDQNYGAQTSGIYGYNTTGKEKTEFDRKDKPATPEGEKLEGAYAGFQPKPAVEPIIVAMKPLSEKTYVEQALKNKKGITWLGDGRIPAEKTVGWDGASGFKNTHSASKYGGLGEGEPRPEDARFPANVLAEDDVLNDGEIYDGGNYKEGIARPRKAYFEERGGQNGASLAPDSYGDAGSFSRYFDLDAWFERFLLDLPEPVRKVFPFFIVPKPTKQEKDMGLRGKETKKVGHGNLGNSEGFERFDTKGKNPHPTVKPIKLFSYLVTIGSRKGDLILDPYAGSGTLGVAATLTERNSICIELQPENAEIAKARVAYALKNVQMTLF